MELSIFLLWKKMAVLIQILLCKYTSFIPLYCFWNVHVGTSIIFKSHINFLTSIRLCFSTKYQYMIMMIYRLLLTRCTYKGLITSRLLAGVIPGNHLSGIEAKTKWLPISKHFQVHFLVWKLLHFDFNFMEICCQGPVYNINQDCFR